MKAIAERRAWLVIGAATILLVGAAILVNALAKKPARPPAMPAAAQQPAKAEPKFEAWKGGQAPIKESRPLGRLSLKYWRYVLQDEGWRYTGSYSLKSDTGWPPSKTYKFTKAHGDIRASATITASGPAGPDADHWRRSDANKVDVTFAVWAGPDSSPDYPTRALGCCEDVIARLIPGSRAGLWEAYDEARHRSRFATAPYYKSYGGARLSGNWYLTISYWRGTFSCVSPKGFPPHLKLKLDFKNDWAAFKEIAWEKGDQQ